MFGFLVGAASLIGIGMAAKRRRYGGCGGDEGAAACEHRGGLGRWHSAPWGRRNARAEVLASWLGARLQTSPRQQVVLRDEIDELLAKARGLRADLRGSALYIAEALHGESFDESCVSEAFVRQDAQIADVRRVLVGALARIHDVLDERQRKSLVDLLMRRRAR